jgi:hypothetical protein
MPEMPAAGWFVARNREQDGPFTAARLRQLAGQGWVSPDDLVWHPTLAGWTPARQIDGLFAGGPLARLLGAALPGLRTPSGRPAGPLAPAPPAGGGRPPEPAPRATNQRRRRRARDRTPPRPSVFDFGEVGPRHLLAGCGILVTALGLAFFTIAASTLARALTTGGLLVVALALSPEMVRAAARGVAWLDRVRHEAAERRLEARQRAGEEARLEAEAARLADEERRAAASWSAPPGAERVVVVKEPSRQRFNRWVAGLLSVVPGLGHCYKGEVGPGITWLFVALAAYSFSAALGLILHGFCIIGAVSGEAWTEERTRTVRE